MKARQELSSLENVTKCVEEFNESQTQEDIFFRENLRQGRTELNRIPWNS
jgi:hypothetical protein